MCRLLGYLGPPVQLSRLILEPPHSLVVQSYAPKELAVALLNADGFGLGWYHAQRETEPFTYRNVLPIWNDVNLPALCRYGESGCVLAYVRSATPGQGVDISNCQPFQVGQWLFTHNGYVQRFRETLYRPLGQRMSDRAYRHIHGSTDSEHIWGLVLSELLQPSPPSLATAVEKAVTTLAILSAEYDTPVAANLLVSDGFQLVGARFSSHNQAPSLYWLQNHPQFPRATLVASEPLFAGHWELCPAPSLFTFKAHCDPQFHSLDHLPHYPG